LAQINSSFPRIPATPFVFPDDIYKVPINMSDYIPVLEYLGANMSWGFPFLNETGKPQAQINVVMSLLFNQLADNIHLTTNDPRWSTVSYKGKVFSTVEDFLTSLQGNGWVINGYLEWHVAQFFGIYSNVSGHTQSVADPLMQTTGIWNKNKSIEVTLPAVHSQWMFVVNNSAIPMQFSLDWYQGDTSYGFFPSEMYIITDWSGRSTSRPITGNDVITAVKYMAFTQDVFVRAAESQNLFDAGYGVTGVCDDSCAVIETMMGYNTVMYPLLIQKQLVVPELIKRIARHDKNEPIYYMMLKAINALPMDWEGLNPTTVNRAGCSIVWPPGAEPWQCTVDARNILLELNGGKPFIC